MSIFAIKYSFSAYFFVIICKICILLHRFNLRDLSNFIKFLSKSDYLFAQIFTSNSPFFSNMINTSWWNWLGISRNFVPSCNIPTVGSVFFYTSSRFVFSEAHYTSKMIHTSALLHISIAPGFLILSPAGGFTEEEHAEFRAVFSKFDSDGLCFF